MQIMGMNQRDFSREIGKSQAQVSKYLTGKTDIPDEIKIHCMNILSNHNSTGSSMEELISEVLTLQGDMHNEIRGALMNVISAYRKKSTGQIGH
ncbi:helix-turn-helix domain-containing protein [Serratia proteamaculans]|uniref:helix-turn-helix domain-containing protein n=1 Tax=Serratia proteamaculans TaxID=28151 RepID=UPI0024B3B750|nr:helix-turn-helix transcriptional regulator [Serratia proteamaculans]